MEQSDIFIKLLLTVVFGAILGLETETREIEKKGHEGAQKQEKQRLGGFRTYTIISLFGGIAGIFYNLKAFELSYLIFASIIILVLTAYFLNVQIKKAFGLTTEIAILITFILGFLTTSNIVRFEILLGILVLLAFFLSQKRGIGLLIQKVKHKEIIDIIRFGLVSAVMLPILPNQDFYLYDIINLINIQNINDEAFKQIYIINPFKIWGIVVLISGLNLLAYFLSRVFGSGKGIFFASIFGGFFSSTSTTISFASKAKNLKDKNQIRKFAGGSVVANGASFIFAGILLLVSSFALFRALLPVLGLMLIAGVATGLYLLNKGSKEDEMGADHVPYEPFSVIPAIKFVTIIIVLTVFIQFLQFMKVNETLVILFTAISGVTGLDASIIAISGLYNTGTITLMTAILTFMLTNLVNFIAKAMYAKALGNATFFKYLVLGLIITTIVSIAGLVFVL